MFGSSFPFEESILIPPRSYSLSPSLPSLCVQHYLVLLRDLKLFHEPADLAGVQYSGSPSLRSPAPQCFIPLLIYTCLT